MLTSPLCMVCDGHQYDAYRGLWSPVELFTAGWTRFESVELDPVTGGFLAWGICPSCGDRVHTPLSEGKREPVLHGLSSYNRSSLEVEDLIERVRAVESQVVFAGSSYPVGPLGVAGWANVTSCFEDDVWSIPLKDGSRCTGHQDQYASVEEWRASGSWLSERKDEDHRYNEVFASRMGVEFVWYRKDKPWAEKHARELASRLGVPVRSLGIGEDPFSEVFVQYSEKYWDWVDLQEEFD